MPKHIRRAAIRASGLAFLMSLAFASSVPDEYQDLFIHLNTYLTTLHQDLDRRWDHQLHPGFIPMAGLLPANSNSGLELLREGNLEMTGLFIERLREMGCRGVQLDIQFPVLDPNYYIFAKAHGLLPASSPGAAEMLAHYKAVVQEIRRQGLKLSIESQVVFTQPTFSSLPVAEYYRYFDADGWAGLARYKQYKLDMLKTIALELRPDFLTIGDEPETEMWLTKIRLLADPDNYFQMTMELTAGVKTVRPAGLKIGSGFLPGTDNWRYWAEHLSSLDIDFINIHIYPIDVYPDDRRDNVTQRALEAADMAAAAGKTMAMGETWLYKQGDHDTNDPVVLCGRDYFDFWEPLDTKFLSLMLKIMHFKRFEFMSPFWSLFFFSYLSYEEAQTLTTDERIRLNNQRAVANLRAGVLSDVGRLYSQMITQGPDLDLSKRSKLKH
ncbi:MAG: hypothetical protein WCB96_00790 [Candidatus Aminicenantales bacterium]